MQRFSFSWENKLKYKFVQTHLCKTCDVENAPLLLVNPWCWAPFDLFIEGSCYNVPNRNQLVLFDVAWDTALK